jgi:hypothetical protein
MKRLPRSRMVCLVVPLAFAAGCGNSPQAPVAEQPTTVVNVQRLPGLDDPMAPLDEGRIQVARPKGWHTPSRSSKWIVRFTPSSQFSYPSIIVTAEDYEPVFHVTKQDVDRFAEQIAAALKQDPKTARLTQPVRPVEVGPFVGISYQKRGKATYEYKKIVLERLFLETVVAGRKYGFELRTRTGTVEKFRPYLLAVAAGARFLQAETAQSPEKEPGAPPEAKPEQTPGEKPAEGPPPSRPEPQSEFESVEEDDL